jgi:hypothetical protein
MFNNFKLEAKIENLEREVFGDKEDTEKTLDNFFDRIYLGYFEVTLKKRVDNLQEILEKQEKLTHMILEHMRLEYVKITEENGDKTEKEILRPITKKKLKDKNKEKGNCDCCDYAD